MITKISLKNVATFQNEVLIDDLKKINFFYGSNGTGKTTISKVIANPDNYYECSAEWNNNNKLKTIVFNEDFVREYFYEKDALQGIYTIGEEVIEVEEQIKNKNSEKEQIQKEIDNLNHTIQEKKNEESNIHVELKENCWQTGYQGLQNDFSQFFTGYKSNKEKFANKILEENNSNQSDLLNLEKLKEKYHLLYDKEATKVDELQLIKIDDIENLEKNQSILQISIIGKKDVDIAKMIEKLHNHDWVKQGKKYYESNYDEKDKSYICPFCQQKTTNDFKQQLEEYFDETYNEKIKELEEFISNYKKATDFTIKSLDDIISKENQYINEKKETLKDKYNAIKATIQKNNQSLEHKKNNPSITISIESIVSQLNEINNILNEVNNKIKEHNSLIENRENEKKKFQSEMWRYICEKLKSEIQNYRNDESNIKIALDNLNKQKEEKEEKIKVIKEEISNLEKKIISVKPTIDNINILLNSFGFNGFSLKPTDDDKHYQIVRGDGSDAKKTLSEGERNFLVFLYFYHLVNGVITPDENINQDKILVIDDPVSSFDSNILFIVSTLIREVIDKVRRSKNPIKQIFIFTHNAYFYKEVTFISSRESCYNQRNDTQYYIVRKKDNVSFVESYMTCPIKTSYQLLWDDMKRSEIDCISLQNSMRRIIEFYFKFLANIKEDELLNKFNGVEKNICKSLITWVNAGSHEIIDDFNVSITNEQIESYRNVFRRIFEITGHTEHYNMMMGIQH